MHGLEYLDLDEEEMEKKFEKFSEIKRTKMKEEDRQFKNKKRNKGKIKAKDKK